MEYPLGLGRGFKRGTIKGRVSIVIFELDWIVQKGTSPERIKMGGRERLIPGSLLWIESTVLPLFRRDQISERGKSGELPTGAPEGRF